MQYQLIKNKFIIICFSLISFSACVDNTPLPVLGRDHKIPDFKYLNQDSIWIDNTTFENGIYVADFFFTSCPSICPRVAQQMLRIQDAYKSEPLVKLVSYTIDPKRDTPTKLKNYANKLGANFDQWHFLTGEQESTFELADKYWVSAFKDDLAPGGFDHSGKILLIDGNRQIRSFCDGTSPESVTRFIKDIKKLVKEVKNNTESTTTLKD